MAQSGRTINSDGLEKPTRGNEAPTGTGTHAAHRHQAEREAEDRRAEGLAGNLKGEVRVVDVDHGEPMTEDQAAHLRILCAEAGEEFEPNLTRYQADQRIRDYQRRAGYKP